MNQDKPESFNFELVTPDAVLHQSKEVAVTIPAIGGDAMVKTGHQKMVINLTHGICRVHKSDKQEIPFYITGGFADITPAHCCIATENAEAVAQINLEKIAKTKQILSQELDDTDDSIERDKLTFKLSELTKKIDIVTAYQADSQ